MFWFLKRKELKYLIISIVLFFGTWALVYFGLSALFTPVEGAETLSDYTVTNGPVYYFINNFLHCLVCIIGCGILSVPLLMFNAVILGSAGVALVTLGGSVSLYAAMTLPHCIVELPALILATACGMKLFSLLRRYIKGQRTPDMKQDMIGIGKTTVLIAVLILAAAFLEAYLTPVIAAWYL